MNKRILNKEVQQFINAHINDDIVRILFKKSPFDEVTSKELAEQIESKKASEKKLPLWFDTKGIYYPPKLSIEQTSSEVTANYKSSLATGKSLIDVTGGLGVDSFYFSKKFDTLTHCEINPDLSAIAKHNAALLGAENIRFVNADGIEFLKSDPGTFDTAYIDPSRRKTDKKVFLLSDCEPNVVENFDLLLSKANRIIIKTSPILDITSGLRELRNVSEIHVVSLKNDCKELLWIIDQEYVSEPEIFCVALNEGKTQKVSFKLSEEKILQLTDYAEPKQYVYEPDVTLLKAGCFKLITKKFKVQKIASHTHLYTSSELIDDFIGRVFEATSIWSYKDFTKSRNFSKANVICRNFPLTPEEIKKKNKIQDGGEDYLIFATNSSAQLLAIHARRI